MGTELRPIPTSTIVINIGPSHPVTHGTLRIQMELDGETILRSGCEIGYLHRGFEKQSENCFYQQVIPYAERLNYCSPVNNSNAWCYAIEQLMGIEAPPRAQALRVITSEMGRIIDHAVCNSANLVDLGALTNFWYLFAYREQIYDLYEELCGARMMVNYPRIGGVCADLTPGWIDKCKAVMADLSQPLADVRGLTAKNRIFCDRTQGVCTISKDLALNHGFSGPPLRATGIAHDLRKAEPYWGYDQYDFDIPVGTNGDTFDRIMLRFDEMEQSRRIILQALDNLPVGPVMIDDPLVALPSKETTYGTMEGLISHFKLIMHGVQPARGEIYSRTEGANGELGYYIVSDGGPRAYRVRVRPPCFANYSAFPKMIRGEMLADAVAALGSINVIAGELDR